MSSRPQLKHWRAILLFLLTVVLPCGMLVGLGVRIVAQDQELAATRAADQRRQEVAAVRGALLQRLESIRLKAASMNQPLGGVPEPALVFAGRLANHQLELPWEHDVTATSGTRLLTEARFSAAIRKGERAEFVDKRTATAAAFYHRAEIAASHELQRAYAGLLRARALAASGKGDDAKVVYQHLAGRSLQLADEHGVPIALYAAQRLALSNWIDHHGLFELLTAALDRRAWSPPAEAYLLKQLTGPLVERAPAGRRPEATALADRVSQRLSQIEHALSLQRDMATLKVVQSSDGSVPKWTMHGEPPWLVTIAPGLDPGEAVVVAVDANRVVASVAGTDAIFRRVIRIARVGSSTGMPLGEELSGLQISFDDDPAKAAAPQRPLYLVALGLIVGVAGFSGYLLWRDTQRELRIADLRSQFVANVSHELKTPLTAIRMFADTLSMGRPADAQTRAEYLETIVVESERLTRLLDNVLNFSRIEQARRTYRLTEHRLNEVVTAAARTLSHSFAQQGMELRVRVDEQLPPMLIDADAIGQAVLNLLSNAMKYSVAGGAIDLSLEQQGHHAVISVTDRGIGVARHEHQRIFEKFYRAATEENRTIPGAGIGLSLVQHVVVAHHGRVVVQSVPGAGSTFSIRLPIAQGAEAGSHSTIMSDERLANRS